MSIERCDKHDRHYDTDEVAECPVCLDEASAPKAFVHDLATCGINVRTGKDGTWVELRTADGSSFMFQPLSTFPPKHDRDLSARIVRQWCAERAAECAPKVDRHE